MRSVPVRSVSSLLSTLALPAEGRPGLSDDDDDTVIVFCVNSAAPAALPITVECFLPIGSPPRGLPMLPVMIIVMIMTTMRVKMMIIIQLLESEIHSSAAAPVLPSLAKKSSYIYQSVLW